MVSCFGIYKKLTRCNGKKHFLRQSLSNKNTNRIFFSRKTIVENSTTENFESYRHGTFFHNFLIHFSDEKMIYIDIDAYKKRGFRITVYHFKTTGNPQKPKRIDMEPIFCKTECLTNQDLNIGRRN